jgi:hypothetical protein
MELKRILEQLARELARHLKNFERQETVGFSLQENCHGEITMTPVKENGMPARFFENDREVPILLSADPERRTVTLNARFGRRIAEERFTRFAETSGEPPFTAIHAFLHDQQNPRK